MKKNILFLIAILCIAVTAYSQAPALLNYQGVARNPVGNVLINKVITLRLSIHESSANGASVYSETRSVTTNGFGLFNVQIGSPGAFNVSGTVAGINWGLGTKFIKVEADQNGGSNFIEMGASQLASVPFAMNALGALPQGPAGGSLTGTYPNPVVANAAITAPMIAAGVIPTALPPNGAAGGDLSGNFPNPAVAKIQGRAVSNNIPIVGQSLVWNDVTAQWEPGLPSGTGTITLPFSATENNATTLFSIANEGNGTVINATASGNGVGVKSSSGNGFAVHGITTSVTSAGIIGDNISGGEAIVGRVNSDIAGAVVGRNDGGGYGVRGFIAANTDNTAVGVQGEVGNNGSTGMAGRFINFNKDNTEANVLQVNSNSRGNVSDFNLGNASSFFVDNVNSVGAGVKGEVNTIFSNFGAAGIVGISSGTGGKGGLFYSSNPTGNGVALIALTDGNGNAITANAGKNGNAVEANIDGNGNALYAWVPNFGTGRAGRFENFNTNNTKEVITVKTVGNGIGGSFFVDNKLAISPAVKGEVNSQFANFGTAGIYGISSGTGGYAGLFHSSNTASGTTAVIVLNEGHGNAITANAGQEGDGLEASVDGNGNAIYGFVPNFGAGKAARFANFNSGNAQPVVHVTNAGAGNAMLINHTGASGNIAIYQSGDASVARIDKNGRGFFNGGTQNSGADVAETFAVEGNINSYEPGDVLVISTASDRTVEKSSTPYSTLVSGIYATQPGVLLTEHNASEDDLSGMVPMGVIGVIPTKVSTENGVIKRGDLIVTSSLPGVAMKADPDKVKVGQVIGKALQDYDGQGIGKIKILVSIK